jgi:four helix bundle protein
MSEQSEALKERSMSFAIAILRLIDDFPHTPGAQVVARQLAKSATSIGANYRAACTGRSRDEFVAKLCIVNEESDESVYWLELAVRANYGPDQIVREWLQESIELRAIFGTSLATARQNHRRGKPDPRRTFTFVVNDQMTK